MLRLMLQPALIVPTMLGFVPRVQVHQDTFCVLQQFLRSLPEKTLSLCAIFLGECRIRRTLLFSVVALMILYFDDTFKSTYYE